MVVPQRPKRIVSTDRTTNVEVDVTGEQSLDAMESLLVDAASGLGMYVSHVTVLGTRRYPGNRHWHLKQDPRARGCLDVTYWPDGPQLWISMRTSEPDWVHESGAQLAFDLARRLAAHDAATGQLEGERRDGE